jgi:hypothetical protein
VTSHTEGFSHFVTSMTAPVASGWSGRRVGLAPTGKRRLLTAHANSGRSLRARRTGQIDLEQPSSGHWLWLAPFGPIASDLYTRLKAFLCILRSGRGRARAGTGKIAAILVADIVGYSRLGGADEYRTLSRLRGLRSDLIDPAIAAHQGRIVKRTGDGSLIEFRSVVDAVRCAIELQNGMAERNAPAIRAPHRIPGRHPSRRCSRGERRRPERDINIASRLEASPSPARSACQSNPTGRSSSGSISK